MSSKNTADYDWVGWVIAIVAILIVIIWIVSANSNKATGSWRCVDVTSYNHNAYDDNKCTNGDEVRYVSDSQAEALESDYSPGKSGASYYNNQ